MKKVIIMFSLFMLVLIFSGCSTTKETTAPAQANEIPQNPNIIIYQNNQYGFNFALPKSWQGYKIINETWKGLAQDETGAEITFTQGPEILIRHPEYTKENPRQDIPVMIFTSSQWRELQNDKFHIGAAPIGPSELGNNSQYVFALPARYNFAFPTGYEEVKKILNSHPLEPTEKFSSENK